MPGRKIIDFQSCRELLSKWSGLREGIVSGEVVGLAVCVKRKDGSETVTLAGNYSIDKEEALRAAMALSWELTKREDFRFSKT